MPKQEDRRNKFCLEYLVDLNATQAAIRAGYSKKTAKSQGQRLSTKVDIREKIKELQGEQEKRTLVTTDYVILGLKQVAERCLQAKPKMIFDKEEKSYVQKMDEETGQPIFEFDSAGANRAFELLGKHLNIFSDNVNVKVIDYKQALTEDLKNRENLNKNVSSQR